MGGGYDYLRLYLPLVSDHDGGVGGIRTHGGHKGHNGFRDRPDRPLRHLPLSAVIIPNKPLTETLY